MSSLAGRLKSETALVERFRDTLLLEQETLRSGSADELADVNTKKLALVDSINTAGTERALLLTSGKSSTIDMNAWFSGHPLETESAKLWEGLLKVAREAREINVLNGSLINKLHQKTSDALSILTRNDTGQSLYSRDGQAASGTGSRIIDSA
jgi:flagella synthesis protein FlgN